MFRISKEDWFLRITAGTRLQLHTRSCSFTNNRNDVLSLSLSLSLHTLHSLFCHDNYTCLHDMLELRNIIVIFIMHIKASSIRKKEKSENIVDHDIHSLFRSSQRCQTNISTVASLKIVCRRWRTVIHEDWPDVRYHFDSAKYMYCL